MESRRFRTGQKNIPLSCSKTPRLHARPRLYEFGVYVGTQHIHRIHKAWSEHGGQVRSGQVRSGLTKEGSSTPGFGCRPVGSDVSLSIFYHGFCCGKFDDQPVEDAQRRAFATVKVGSSKSSTNNFINPIWPVLFLARHSPGGVQSAPPPIITFLLLGV